MSDLVVKRFNMVTVHSRGETYEDMREKPNGEFCRYREANFSHKEIINSMAGSEAQNQGVNEELLDSLVRLESWASTMHGHGVSYSGDHPIAKAKSAIAKALGQ